MKRIIIDTSSYKMHHHVFFRVVKQIFIQLENKVNNYKVCPRNIELQPRGKQRTPRDWSPLFLPWLQDQLNAWKWSEVDSLNIRTRYLKTGLLSMSTSSRIIIILKSLSLNRLPVWILWLKYWSVTQTKKALRSRKMRKRW